MRFLSVLLLLTCMSTAFADDCGFNYGVGCGNSGGRDAKDSKR